MADSTGTGAGGDADGSTPGAVPPGQSQGEGKPPGDDYVKKSQFIAALNSATGRADAEKARADNLQRQLDEAKAKSETPKEVSRAELRRLVEAGDITQDQADQLYEKQLADKIRRQVSTEVGQTMTVAQRQSYVEAQLAGYRQLVADAWVEGTPERAKAAAEYQHMLSLGHPQGRETEAAALRAAFGDLASLQASKSARPGSSETHSETGGGKPAGGGQGDAIKGLTDRQREHYGRLISQGVYAGWDAVKAELKESKPSRRSRP